MNGTFIAIMALGLAIAVWIAVAEIAHYLKNQVLLRILRADNQQMRLERRLLRERRMCAEQQLDIEAVNDLDWAERMQSLAAEMEG